MAGLGFEARQSDPALARGRGYLSLIDCQVKQGSVSLFLKVGKLRLRRSERRWALKPCQVPRGPALPPLPTDTKHLCKVQPPPGSAAGMGEGVVRARGALRPATSTEEAKRPLTGKKK